MTYADRLEQQIRLTRAVVVREVVTRHGHSAATMIPASVDQDFRVQFLLSLRKVPDAWPGLVGRDGVRYSSSVLFRAARRGS